MTMLLLSILLICGLYYIYKKTDPTRPLNQTEQKKLAQYKEIFGAMCSDHVIEILDDYKEMQRLAIIINDGTNENLASQAKKIFTDYRNLLIRNGE